MEDFADQVRQAYEDTARDQQKRQAADEKLLAEQLAAEAAITKAASQLARALHAQDAPTDIVVEHFESRIRIKRFGKQVREEATHHVLNGWVFGDTRHTFTDNESQSSRTETSLEGFILAEDGSVHHCHVSDIGIMNTGQIVVTVRDPWGSSIHNGPMDKVMMHMNRDRILKGMAQLAVKRQIDPSLLT